MLKGFREFILRGNVIDLAVGVVIGAAFGQVVTQIVNSFLDPLVRLVTGGKRASGTWSFGNGIVMDWGAFVNAVIAFFITAAAIYFFVVMPLNKLAERRRRREPTPEEMSDEVRLLTEIRDALTGAVPAHRTIPAERTGPADRPGGAERTDRGDDQSQ